MSTTADVGGVGLDPALAPLVERTRGLQPFRRLFHACNGILLALVPPQLDLSRPTVMVVLAALFLVLLAGDVARLRLPRLNRLFFRAFPALASPREADGIASSTWYAAGGLLTWALFPAPIAVPAILVLGLADPAAGTVGRLWGRRRLGSGTVLGSLAFCAVALAVTAWFVDPLTALGAALVATAIEALPWMLDDNFTVPLAVGGALWLIGG